MSTRKDICVRDISALGDDEKRENLLTDTKLRKPTSFMTSRSVTQTIDRLNLRRTKLVTDTSEIQMTSTGMRRDHWESREIKEKRR
jgi:hypothetical protein